VILTSGLDEDLPERVAGSGSDVAQVEHLATVERAPVRQAKAFLDAQEAILERVRSQHFPRLDANMMYARQAFPRTFPSWGDFNTNWTVGLSMSMNFFSGFRITGDVDYAKADVYEARARLRQTEERARLDTYDATRQLEAAHANLTATAGTVAQAQRAYDIAELRYGQGVSTQLELSDARLQLQTARANRARASRDVQVATVRIALLPLLPISTPSTSALPAPSRTSTLQVGLGSQAQGSQSSMGSTSSPNITSSTATSLTSPSSQGTR
jgi:outer membrane protein TolC